MAHLILKDMFVSTQPEWHTVGHRIPQGSTAMQFVEKHGMNYRMEKQPLFAGIGNNSFFAIPDRYAIMREPIDHSDWKYFATCGKNYELLQNQDIAQLSDIITEVSGWQLETMGVLEDGKTFFVVYAVGETEIKGEQVKNYLFFYDRRDGTSELLISATSVRVVCWNTAQLALKNLKTSIGLRHSRGLLQETGWRMNLLKDALQSGDNLVNALRKLGDIPFTSADMQEFVIDLFPYPKMPRSADLRGSSDATLNLRGTRAMQQFETKKNQADRARTLVTGNFNRLNDEFTAIANTGWAGFNAVTQYVTHQMGANSAENRAINSIFKDGDDIRTKAYELIVRK